MEKLIIGCHVSFTKTEQLVGSVKQALSYGANTFMFYTGAPQNTKREKIDESLVLEAKKIMSDNGIDINDVVVHAPYIINLANKKNQKFSVDFLKEELNRVNVLGVKKLVLHPGSHIGEGIDVGINNIIDGLKLVLKSDVNVEICLETMAGKGSECASNFLEIKEIIDGVNDDRIRVCLDTCHINDAGYNLNEFDKVLKEFDDVIGLDKLSCIHINDSKNERSSHKDRHENIGYGTIGFDNLIKVIYNPLLVGIPKILETPFIKDEKDSYPPYKAEIEMIINKKFNSNLIDDVKSYYKKIV